MVYTKILFGLRRENPEKIMIDFIDNIGSYNIIFVTLISSFLLYYIANKFKIKFLSDIAKKERLILITSLILLLLLFVYNLNSYEELQFNNFKLSEQEQIQYLKNYINKTESRNNNIISSFLILVTIIIICIIPKKEKIKQT